MDSVLVIGRIRGDRRDEVNALLACGEPGWRAFRQGETLALLVEAPRAGARFLRLLKENESRFSRLVDCLQEVPIVPLEVTPTRG